MNELLLWPSTLEYSLLDLETELSGEISSKLVNLGLWVQWLEFNIQEEIDAQIYYMIK